MLIPPASSQLVPLDSYLVGAVRVLIVEGDVDLADQRRVERAISTALNEGPVVVDLHRVSFFAISALGALLRCRRHGLVAGHPLVLASPRPQVARLLRAARLARQLPCVNSVDTACDVAARITRLRNPQRRVDAA